MRACDQPQNCKDARPRRVVVALGGLCCKTRVLFKARPDLSIAEPVVFSTVPSGGAID
jgi:hypothetical protein